jgi:uncharacterized membrane protein YeaQ/YmgE (transglycosylase-associated protein family)
VSWIAFLLLLVAQGVVVGGLGRLVVPGPDPMGLGKTALVGIGGSLLAGIVARALFNSYAGLVLSVLGAALIVLLLRRWDERHGRRPTGTGRGAAGSGRRGRWFVLPGIAGGVWTSSSRHPGADDPIDLRDPPPTRRRSDPDEIVDAEVVDDVPPGAQVVESEVLDDERPSRRRPSRRF